MPRYPTIVVLLLYVALSGCRATLAPTIPSAAHCRTAEPLRQVVTVDDTSALVRELPLATRITVAHRGDSLLVAFDGRSRAGGPVPLPGEPGGYRFMLSVWRAGVAGGQSFRSNDNQSVWYTAPFAAYERPLTFFALTDRGFTFAVPESLVAGATTWGLTLTPIDAPTSFGFPIFQYTRLVAGGNIEGPPL